MHPSVKFVTYLHVISNLSLGSASRPLSSSASRGPQRCYCPCSHERKPALLFRTKEKILSQAELETGIMSRTPSIAVGTHLELEKQNEQLGCYMYFMQKFNVLLE